MTVLRKVLTNLKKPPLPQTAYTSKQRVQLLLQHLSRSSQASKVRKDFKLPSRTSTIRPAFRSDPNGRALYTESLKAVSEFYQLPRPSSKEGLYESVSGSHFRLPIDFHSGSSRERSVEPISYLIPESTEEVTLESNEELLYFLKENLPLQGRLVKTSKGLVYLELDDRYLTLLTPFLGPNIVPPPYFNSFTLPDGPHIQVISEREFSTRELMQVTELDQEFTFKIKGIRSVRPTDWEGVETAWFLEVESESLELLREKYHLSPKLRGHPFHIVIGIKPGLSTQNRPLSTMRINPALLSA